MLKSVKNPPLIAGNIGTVASGVAEHAKPDDSIVIELSSFQLMGIDEFRPEISIVTNLYDAHFGLSQFQTGICRSKSCHHEKNQIASDFMIYNADQDLVLSMAKRPRLNLYLFQLK